MDLIFKALAGALGMLVSASPYVVFGLIISGFLKVFMNPQFVSAHLGEGRFKPVFKASLFGIPIPLCSCSVLPAAVSLKEQGANNGAVTAFMISTPESGVDSITVSWALLDPIMTIIRPAAAFTAALWAGVLENLFEKPENSPAGPVSPIKRPDAVCCPDKGCSVAHDPKERSFFQKLRMGSGYAFGDIWADMAGWFFLGIIIAGLVEALVPRDVLGQYLGGGIWSMLIMLGAGIPVYICATASTPIAAGLILQGVSPGAALVFLLAGPATNAASLTVLFGVLGKRAAVIYLASISITAVGFGLIVDRIYDLLGLSAAAMLGRAGEAAPQWMGYGATGLLLALSIKPFARKVGSCFSGSGAPAAHGACSGGACGCSGVQASAENLNCRIKD